jgi:hypothetical protein
VGCVFNRSKPKDSKTMDAINAAVALPARSLHDELLASAEAAHALLARSRGNDHDNSPFHISVFDSGFACFLAALDDSQRDQERMRIFSAATGAGKTTCGTAYIAGLIESADAFEAEYGHRPSALIVVEQKTKADQTYRDMVKLLGTKRVAVYTQDHDKEHEHDTPEQLEADNNRTVYTPAAWFAREELAHFEVAIVTANFFRNGGRGNECGMELAGYMADGRRRDFVLIDEQIEEVKVFPVVCSEISTAHKRIQERVKLGHQHANEALAAITPLKEFAEDMDRKRTPLEVLAAEARLEWFTSEAAAEFVEGMDSTTRKVFEFAKCYRVGYAFVSRTKIGANRWETIYTGYRPDMECMPGSMVLDASAAVDGVAQLSPWRVQAQVPRVDYSNLTVIAVPEFDKGARAANFYKFAKNRVRYAEFARGIITKHLQPGQGELARSQGGLETHRVDALVGASLLARGPQRVLVACRKDLIPEFTDWRPSDERYRQAVYRRGGDGGYLVDVGGVRCAVTNYGDGVGSNEYKEASAVVLLDNFWIPVREAIAQGLGLQRKPAEGQGLSKSLNTNHPAVKAILEGTALRQILQMTGRGMVRNVDHRGRCGEMVLVYSGDIDLLRRNLRKMFPGAKLVDETGWKPRTYTERIMATLDGTPRSVWQINTDDMAAALGAKSWRSISRLVPTSADLAAIGWEYLPGKARRPGVFQRSDRWDF